MTHHLVTDLDHALAALDDDEVAALVPALRRVFVQHGLILERVGDARKTAVPLTLIASRMGEWFERFGGRYHELAMFADDVWMDYAVDVELPVRLSFEEHVVRIAPGHGPRPTGVEFRAARGHALLLKSGTAIPTFGVLVGEPVNGRGAARHVFVLVWDAALQDWRATGEGQGLFVRWVKKVLLAYLDKEPTA